jgi:hypothetical protein
MELGLPCGLSAARLLMMANMIISHNHEKQRDLRPKSLENRRDEPELTDIMINEAEVLRNQLLEQKDLQIDMSTIILEGTIATIGPSTIPGLNIILRHLDAFLEFNNFAVFGETCSQVLDIPLSATNVFSKIPLIERWVKAEMIKSELLEEDEEQSNVKSFLDTWIENLSRCSPEIRQHWNFSNDPILDIYEQLIEFLDYNKADTSVVDHYKQSYANYSHKTYRDRETWICLGCVLGVFDLKIQAFTIFESTVQQKSLERNPRVGRSRELFGLHIMCRGNA